VDDRELEQRVTDLERENAELRALVPAGEDIDRRRKVSRMMMAGGLVALATGIFGASWYAIILGVGWLFAGASVASTLPGRS
jgi:hypothetical protein